MGINLQLRQNIEPLGLKAALKTWEQLKGQKICGIQGAWYNKPVAEKFVSIVDDGTPEGAFDEFLSACESASSDSQAARKAFALLAPDVTVEGQQALSFGMQVTAVHAGVY